MIEQPVKNEGLKAGQKKFPKKKLREKKRFYLCISQTTCDCLLPTARSGLPPIPNPGPSCSSVGPVLFFMKLPNNKGGILISRKLFKKCGPETAIFLALLLEEFRLPNNEIEFYIKRDLPYASLRNLTGFGRRIVERCTGDLIMENLIVVTLGDYHNTNGFVLIGGNILELYND